MHCTRKWSQRPINEVKDKAVTSQDKAKKGDHAAAYKLYGDCGRNAFDCARNAAAKSNTILRAFGTNSARLRCNAFDLAAHLACHPARPFAREEHNKLLWHHTRAQYRACCSTIPSLSTARVVGPYARSVLHVL
eukprot:778622-Rhodomonas_salina.1